MGCLLTTLLLCSLLCGCGGKEQGAGEANTAAVRVPDAGVPAGGDALPESLNSTTPPEEHTDSEARAPAALLTPAVYALFVRGLPLPDARALTAIEPVRVGGDGKSTEIYRWTDERGSHFTARFEGGALITKSSLGAQHAARTAAPPDLGQMPVAQIAPGVYIPLERAVASATEQPMGVDGPPQYDAPDAPPMRWTAPESRAEGPRVAVAGAARRAREAAANPGTTEATSYNPRAKLPEFARSLREGSFEIRFINPGDAPITAGLRQENLGSDATVPPKGQASIKVDRGAYALFFIRDDEPYTLYEANAITIDGFQTTDVEVHLKPDDVEVRLIDYSRPEE